MLTVHTIYAGDLRTHSRHIRSGERLVTDAPPDNKGRGEAFSPTDLLATSLGSCMLTIIGIAAREHGIDITGAEVEIRKHMSSNPRRVSQVDVVFFFPNTYTTKEKKLIEQSGRTCPVALSLHPDLRQEITFHFGKQRPDGGE